MKDKGERKLTYSKGIFWVADGQLVYCSIPCNENGVPIEELNKDAVSNSGATYNHEKYWATLSKSITGGKVYNYYPRGRVEISRGRCKVFLSPYICTDKIRELIVAAFGLTGMPIDIIADGSSHYRCFFDNS